MNVINGVLGLFSTRTLVRTEKIKRLKQHFEKFRVIPEPREATKRLADFDRLLKPYKVDGVGKVRLGSPNDGGYVCLDDFSQIDAALSLGIAQDVTWDADVADKGILVYQFDYTIENPPVERPLFRFNRSKICGSDCDGGKTIGTVARENHLSRPTSVLLKMDIEGDEWPVLDALSNQTRDLFSQIICEFHGFDRIIDDAWYARALRVLETLTEQFKVVHIHGNNCAAQLIIGNRVFPQLLEVTFANKARYRFSKSDEIFPTELDAPNCPNSPDIYLGEFGQGALV
jgi:hypothetical protein